MNSVCDKCALRYFRRDSETKSKWRGTRRATECQAHTMYTQFKLARTHARIHKANANKDAYSSDRVYEEFNSSQQKRRFALKMRN